MTCCARPSIATMDHAKGYTSDSGGVVQMTSRMCLSCGRHWYGPADAVREYTRAEWEAWINSAFDE